jgi:hypothetical protein
MPEHRYHGGGEVFEVNFDDRVVIYENKKPKVVGFNHDRAWRAAMEAAIST